VNDLQIANSVIQAMAKGHVLDQGTRQAELQKTAEEISRLESLVAGLEAQCASLRDDARAKDEKIKAFEAQCAANVAAVMSGDPNAVVALGPVAS
jgi:chromosome segregation ATPase